MKVKKERSRKTKLLLPVHFKKTLISGFSLDIGGDFSLIFFKYIKNIKRLRLIGHKRKSSHQVKKENLKYS